MSQSVDERLGVEPYGDDDSSTVTGNVLTYPRRVMIAVLRALFTQPDLFTPNTTGGSEQIRNPFLLKFEEDGVTLAQDSRLIITDTHSEKPHRKDGRPRIVVGRTSGSFLQRAWEQKQGTWGSSFGGSIEKYAALHQTGLTVRCVARTSQESELLALCVMQGFWMFQTIIKKKTHIHSIEPPVVDQTTPESGDSRGDEYTTTVSTQLTMPVNWDVLPLNPRSVNDICIEAFEVQV